MLDAGIVFWYFFCLKHSKAKIKLVVLLIPSASVWVWKFGFDSLSFGLASRGQRGWSCGWTQVAGGVDSLKQALEATEIFGFLYKWRIRRLKPLAFSQSLKKFLFSTFYNYQWRWCWIRKSWASRIPCTFLFSAEVFNEYLVWVFNNKRWNHERVGKLLMGSYT